ncbi:restriction endonuclease subunit S [Ruminococcus sp.]|uniref:restriction endonuclease subunit S n=1 Tax=Ruminococcus sp. TaxID=41978 RepID=UPI003FD7CF6F
MMATKRLLDVCDFQGGTQPPKDEWINDPREGYVRMLQIRDYSQGDAKYIQYVKDTKKLHKCTKDDIMLSRYGYIGQAFIGLEGAYNVALVKVIKKAEIHTPYLLCYFQSYYFQHFLLSNVGARATIPGFNKDELEKALIRIPEMCKQIEIASKITKVDELIGFHKQQLNVLDTLIKSRFIEMFGDPVTNPLRWAMLPLEKCLTVLGGYAFKSEEFKTSGVPVLRIGNINTGAFTPTNMVYWSKDDCLTRYQVLPGDLVISLTGTVGKDDYGNVCILGDAYPMYYLNQRNAKLILDDELNKHYLSELLKFSQIKKKLTGISRGVRQANISNRDILNLVVPIPPIEIQVQFAAFVEQVDKSKFYIVQMQILLRLLTRAIQQKTTEVLL